VPREPWWFVIRDNVEKCQVMYALSRSLGELYWLIAMERKTMLSLER